MSGGTELISTAFATPALTVPGDVAHDLAAPGRVPDMNRVVQVKVRGYRGHVIGVVVHIVAVGDLRGAPMAATVMGDDTVTVQPGRTSAGCPSHRLDSGQP